jgi:pimeloyl-ACP methyl ester carboxylesterase
MFRSSYIEALGFPVTSGILRSETFQRGDESITYSASARKRVMPLIESHGKHIAYQTGRGGITQDRRTLVFVHGSGGSHHHWNHQRQFFQESYNVVLVDLPGHGPTGCPGEESVDLYAEHLFSLVRSLPGDVFCLLGHSLGGAIIQTFALRYSHLVEALALVGTGARLRVSPEILHNIQERFQDTVRLIGDFAFAKGASPGVIRNGMEALLKTSPTVIHGDFTACNRFDIMNRVGDIQALTLVICGSEDRFTPPKYAHFLAESITGARLEIIRGSGHMVMLERPDEFNRSVKEFLETLDQADRS